MLKTIRNSGEIVSRDEMVNRLDFLVAQLQAQVKQLNIDLTIAEQDIDRLEKGS